MCLVASATLAQLNYRVNLMTLWGEMKQQVLQGLLRDDEAERYTDEQMAYYARWAMVELSAHTAASDLKVYQLDGSSNKVELPANIIDSIDKSGLVIYVNGNREKRLVHFKRLPGTTWITGSSSADVYYEFPSNQITLGFMPSPGTSLILNYFRIWNTPKEDNDVLEIPQWMELPFAYFIAALALEPVGTQAANVRQWNRKQDSGTPEQNPALRQVEHFVKQAYRILGRFAPQDRETFYKMNSEEK